MESFRKSKANMLVIGKIVGFHGVYGEVKVPFSDRLYKNLSTLKQLQVAVSHEHSEVLDIEYYKVHKTNILIKFKQYSDKTQVEKLKGADLKINISELAPLDEEEYFIKDLIGLNVFDTDKNLLGVVNSVLTSSGADDLIELKTCENKLRLIPFVEEFVPEVNMKDKYLTVKVIPGLIDDEI